ncbi:TPA: hypothetical protein VD593_000394 [Streptococcus pyogenes]|nr:hypothetical protein [Streptococcus pyogenes]
MKTKSKRFLNLATLCLALLGTTLLMGQPIKAEAVVSDLNDAVSSMGDTAEETDVNIDGQKDNAPRLFDSSTLEPPTNPYEDAGDTLNSNWFKSGYSDAYGQAYEQGWNDTHPIQSTLIWLWGIVRNLFRF